MAGNLTNGKLAMVAAFHGGKENQGLFAKLIKRLIGK